MYVIAVYIIEAANRSLSATHATAVGTLIGMPGRQDDLEAMLAMLLLLLLLVARKVV